MSLALNEILENIELTPEQRSETLKRNRKPWYPNVGPQMDAYWSDADEVLYGGEPGGGKTDLVLGLAINEHKRSLILRRLNAEVEGLVERTEQILGHRDGYSGQRGIWRRKGRSCNSVGASTKMTGASTRGSQRTSSASTSWPTSWRASTEPSSLGTGASCLASV